MFDFLLGDTIRRVEDDEDPPQSLADLYRLAVAKVKALFSQQPRNVRITTPANIAAGATASRNLTWARALPSAAYNVLPGAIAQLVLVSITNQTATGCTVTVRNPLATAVPAGTELQFTAVPD